MSGKLQMLFFGLFMFFCGIAVITIGCNESEWSSIFAGIGMLLFAIVLWVVMAIKMKYQSNRGLLICLLLTLIPWDV